MRKKSLRGDSLIEVMFSVGIFGLVAVSSIGMMNRGLYTAQNSLEITMARNEIDAQAEAIRFVHSAYVAERNSNKPNALQPESSVNDFTKLWQAITKSPTGATSGDYDCTATKTDAFVLNYRMLGNTTDLSHALIAGTQLASATTYPRIVFGDDSTKLAEHSTDTTSNSAEGIWVTTTVPDPSSERKEHQYYDFYIRTCWNPIGGNPTPNTISTTIRLFNPDYEKLNE